MQSKLNPKKKVLATILRVLDIDIREVDPHTVKFLNLFHVEYRDKFKKESENIYNVLDYLEDKQWLRAPKAKQPSLLKELADLKALCDKHNCPYIRFCRI